MARSSRDTTGVLIPRTVAPRLSRWRTRLAILPVRGELVATFGAPCTALENSSAFTGQILALTVPLRQPYNAIVATVETTYEF